MSRKKAKRNIGLFLLGIVIAGGYAGYLFKQNLEPLAKGNPLLIRSEAKQPLSNVLHDLEEKKVIRSATALGLYARLKKRNVTVEAGTYRVSPGMTADQIFDSLAHPVLIKVTIPEYYWIARTAELMEKQQVTTVADYEAAAKKPHEFSKDVEFKLPEGSLEGYLFPDTYKMEPKVGAESAIRQQLKAFEKKVWVALGKPKNLHRAVIIGSMVEREAKLDQDRPLIASVIENRLKRNMPLEIDATILYAQQDWHEPSIRELRQTISPYNTYLNKGLPPGPICSPGVKSIDAALHPAKSDFLFYVAMPDGSSLFAKTLAEHNANVAKRRRALRSQR